MNGMTIYQPQEITAANKGKNYALTCNDMKIELKRDTDFGLIPGTKKPTLYKAGAEQITLLCGVSPIYVCETAVEDIENGFFYFRFRCDLEKSGIVVAGGVGACSSKERKYINQSAFDVANTCLKMAKKRALVDAAIGISRLSGIFDQDIENEDFMKGAKAATAKPTDLITTQQARRIFAIGSAAGLTTDEVRNVLTMNGYESTKKIPQKDYDKICEAVKTYGEGANNDGNKTRK